MASSGNVRELVAGETEEDFVEGRVGQLVEGAAGGDWREVRVVLKSRLNDPADGARPAGQ